MEFQVPQDGFLGNRFLPNPMRRFSSVISPLEKPINGIPTRRMSAATCVSYDPRGYPLTHEAQSIQKNLNNPPHSNKTTKKRRWSIDAIKGSERMQLGSSAVVSGRVLQALLRHLQELHFHGYVSMGNSASDAKGGSGSHRGNQGSGGRWVTTGPHDINHELPEYIHKLAKILVSKTNIEEKVDGISKNVFVKYLFKENKSLGEHIFNYLLRKNPNGSNDNTTLLNVETFTTSANDILNILTDADQLIFYIKVFSSDEINVTSEEFLDLLNATYLLTHHLEKDDMLGAVVKAAMHGKSSVSVNYLRTWVSQHCPRLATWLHKYITHMLTTAHRTIPEDTTEPEQLEIPHLGCNNVITCLNDDIDTPVLESISRESAIRLHPALLWLLTTTLPLLFTRPAKKQGIPKSSSLLMDPHLFIDRMITAISPTHWVPLYNSDKHGLSINRLQSHVFNYHGPTIMFISGEQNNMFGLACDEEWRDSKHFFGGENCRLMHLTPEYKVVDSGSKTVYFNVTSRGFPTGLQVGKDSTNRALTMDLNLSLVTYRGMPFKLHAIEVWGCGTTEAIEAQHEIKLREIKDVEKRRKVNLNSVDWKDNPDRYLLELAGTRSNYAQYDRKTQNT